MTRVWTPLGWLACCRRWSCYCNLPPDREPQSRRLLRPVVNDDGNRSCRALLLRLTPDVNRLLAGRMDPPGRPFGIRYTLLSPLRRWSTPEIFGEIATAMSSALVGGSGSAGCAKVRSRNPRVVVQDRRRS